jgi:hypothetical protein
MENPLAIELGNFTLNTATSPTDVLWFIGGLLLLTGITAVTIRWQRRTHPDPFAD